MKTLMFIEHSGIRGGIEVFADRHAAQLRASGREVDIAHCIPARDAGLFFGRYGEVIVHKCTDVRTLEGFPPEKTVLYVHDHEPVCPRTYAYTPFGRNCSRPAGIWPCLLCAAACRSWKASIGRVLSQKRRLRAMARFKKIVVLSEFMKGRLAANGIPEGRISVEPPRIEIPPLGAARDVPGDVDMLFVGQLVRGKGVQLLLEAMAAMKSGRTLDVVGTGNMEPKLKVLADRLGVARRVRWRGFRDNPQDWMRAAKCVVVPSFWQEPYGLVAAEAATLGKETVAFATGGIPEACGGKATLVPAGDVAALAKALERSGTECPER